MEHRLSEGLPPGAPELARFDASVDEVDHRRSLSTKLDPASMERYARCFRRYKEWCSQVGYQSGPDTITADKVREFTIYMTKVGSSYTGNRYTVDTVWTTVRALEVYAERAGLAVSVEPALAILDVYRTELGNPPKRPGRRRRRTSRRY